MSDFRLATPWALLLLVLPLVLGWWLARRRNRVTTYYSSLQLIDGLPVTPAQVIQKTLPALRVLGLLLIVAAASRPQLGLRQFRVRTEGIAIAMCLDRSGSMRALDFSQAGQPINRLEAVKRVVRDFVLGQGGLRGRPDDQICVIAFGGFAEDRSPLTLDHETLVELLDTIEIPEPLTDGQGRIVNEQLLREELSTAIGDAVALAVDRLRQVESESKVVILLSDGENTAGVVTPEQAAEAARTFGIRIYTIGVGSSGLVPFPAIDRFGRETITRQQVRLDEATLKMLAEKTGGRYYNARDVDTLQTIYAEIDRLEKTVSQGPVYTQYNELFDRLLLPGLLLVVLTALLEAGRFRYLP